MSKTQDDTIQFLIDHNIPVTRENYIAFIWGDEVPDPWTPEHEAELPQRLQDWSRFGIEM